MTQQPVGSILEKYRKRMKLTRNQLHSKMIIAAKGNKEKVCSEQYLGQIERGARNPKPTLLKAIFDAIDIRDADEKASAASELNILSQGSIPDTSFVKSRLDHWLEITKMGERELWVISDIPLEYISDGAFKKIGKAVKTNLKIVYWISEDYIVRFWDLLETLKEYSESSKETQNFKNIRCIVCPPETTWFSFSVTDPCRYYGQDIHQPIENEKQKDIQKSIKNARNPVTYMTTAVGSMLSKRSRFYENLGDNLRTDSSYSLHEEQTAKILKRLRPIYEYLIRNPANEYQGYRIVYTGKNP